MSAHPGDSINTYAPGAFIEFPQMPRTWPVLCPKRAYYLITILQSLVLLVARIFPQRSHRDSGRKDFSRKRWMCSERQNIVSSDCKLGILLHVWWIITDKDFSLYPYSSNKKKSKNSVYYLSFFSLCHSRKTELIKMLRRMSSCVFLSIKSSAVVQSCSATVPDQCPDEETGQQKD